MADMTDPTLQRDSDRALLSRFIATSDPSAFEALVNRHGPMLRGLCRRLVGDADPADDVLQATFLVLIDNARAVRGDSVGAWLCGVARHIARRTRLADDARARRERRAARPEMLPPDNGFAELLRVLDEELHQLPDCYRAPLLACLLTLEFCRSSLGFSYREAVTSQSPGSRGLASAPWALGCNRFAVENHEYPQNPKVNSALKTMATADDDGNLQVWDMTAGKPLYENFPAIRLHNIHFSSDGSRLFTLGGAHEWSATTGELLKRRRFLIAISRRKPPHGNCPFPRRRQRAPIVRGPPRSRLVTCIYD